MPTEILLLAVLALATVVLAYLLYRTSSTLFRERREHAEAVEAARADSRQRSRSVNLGQVIEHLTPFMPDYPFNPKDSKFLGSPVDYVVFDGLFENDQVEEVVFVEVKTGKSVLTKRERAVQDAIEEGRVRYMTVRVPTAGELSEGEP